MFAHLKHHLALLSGIPALLNQFNKNRPVVLAYHGIYDGPKRPERLPETFVHIDDLRLQLAAIKKRYRVIQPDEFESAVTSGRPLAPHSALITFDDGYESFDTLAFPVLDSFGIRPIVFVATRNVENHEPFWYDLVWLFLKEGNAEEAGWLFRRIGMLKSSGPDLNPTQLVLNRMKKMLPQERDPIIMEIREAISPNHADSDFPGRLFFAMRPDQLFKLGRAGVVFGGHTHSHTILSVMPSQTVHEEVRTNKLKLCSMVGRDVHFFAYPNGDYADFTADHKAVLKKEGYISAFSLTQKRSSFSDDPMDVSRFNVAPEDSIQSLFVRCTGTTHAVHKVLERIK